MKKIFSMIMALVASLVITSCKDGVGILYNVAIEGNASGDVVVTFPNGDFELTGDAALLFNYSNDNTDVKPADDAPLLGAALESDDKDVRTFADSVDKGFSVKFKGTEAGGSYHVRIKGYAKEPTTGLMILIDKEFNYPEVVDAAE